MWDLKGERKAEIKLWSHSVNSSLIWLIMNIKTYNCCAVFAIQICGVTKYESCDPGLGQRKQWSLLSSWWYGWHFRNWVILDQNVSVCNQLLQNEKIAWLNYSLHVRSGYTLLMLRLKGLIWEQSLLSSLQQKQACELICIYSWEACIAVINITGVPRGHSFT